MSELRSNASIIEVARDLLAALHPTTGTRATGSVVVRASGNDSVFLPRNWHLQAIVNGDRRDELVFKVGQGPNQATYKNGKRVKESSDEPDTDSWWEVTPTGTSVDIVSNLGGLRHNLEQGAKLVFDPPVPGIETEVSVTSAGVTGGTDPNWIGGCMSAVQFEVVTGNSVALDAFRSSADKLPAVIVVWDGTEPADGITQSSLSRGNTSVGSRSGTQLMRERFNLFVVSARDDSDHLRRFEGVKLLDDITKFLMNTKSVDGQIFSSPGGIQVRGRARLNGTSELYQSHYVYVLQVSITSALSRYDFRTFNDWLRTRMITQTFERDQNGDRLVTTDQLIDMT